jgi:hypothetical protein
VSKKWYSYFVVTDEAEGDANSAAPAPRAGDLVSAENQPSEPALDAQAASGVDLAAVYDAAKIGVAAHGYTALKVADMLESEHIRALPADVRKKSVLVALDAAGVKVTDIVEDAVRRDRALDTYERVLEKRLNDLRAQMAAENQRLEDEIAQRAAELRTRIEENAKALLAEQQEFHTWQARKRQEEARIAEAVSHFVSENPISTTRIEKDKGDTDVR